MSISKNRVMVILAAATLTFGAAGAFAGQDRYEDPRYDDSRGNDRYDDRYDDRHDDRYDDGEFEYARVVDVQPLTRRVRVTSPVRECWNETRYDERSYGPSPQRAGSTLLGAAIGAAIGHQIGHGQGRRAATVAGAVIGGAIGNDQAKRREGAYGNRPPPREYTVERCEVRYHDTWEERTDGYRVTYVYKGRRQVTTLPYRPGEKIRVRVDVTPAE